MKLRFFVPLFLIYKILTQITTPYSDSSDNENSSLDMKKFFMEMGWMNKVYLTRNEFRRGLLQMGYQEKKDEKSLDFYVKFVDKYIKKIPERILAAEFVSYITSEQYYITLRETIEEVGGKEGTDEFDKMIDEQTAYLEKEIAKKKKELNIVDDEDIYKKYKQEKRAKRKKSQKKKKKQEEEIKDTKEKKIQDLDKDFAKDDL